MSQPVRRVTSVDVLASAVHRLVPARLGRVVDQARLDVGSLAADLRGERNRPFSSPSRPPERALQLDDVDPLFHALPGALRGPYTLLRGDLTMLARELRGEHPSPVFPRPARATKKGIELTPRQLEVVDLIRETEDALTVVLREPSGAPLSFRAGQFLTLHVEIDGALHRRAYSLSSAPGALHACITIKRIAEGRVSNHLHQSLRVGSTLKVLGPSGAFVAEPMSLPRSLVLYAGGSGITPIASIVQSLLSEEPNTRLTLVYGNRNLASVIFRSRLERLAAEHPERLRLIHVLEQTDDPSGPQGRLDEAMMTSLLDAHSLGERLPGEVEVQHFVCGPRPMMDAIRKVLVARGVAPGAIREERFQSPGRATTRALPTESVTLTLKRAGRAMPLTVLPNQTVLEAALSSGVVLPFSCAMGGCAACRCTVLEGEMVMDEPNCLTDEERNEGKVLTCVGRALGPVTLEVP